MEHCSGGTILFAFPTSAAAYMVAWFEIGRANFIHTYIGVGTSEFKLVSKASGSGFEWFYRAIKSPLRFYSKARVIIRELLRIIFYFGVRARFKFFLEMVDEGNR